MDSWIHGIPTLSFVYQIIYFPKKEMVWLSYLFDDNTVPKALSIF